jgi:hypothetical protein
MGIIAIFQRIGETFVTEAKDALNISPAAFPKGDYQDRTKNLRSSIGYFVLKDGQIVNSKIEGTSMGTATSKVVLASIPKSGYQLIGVAGMEYASYVESRGYNVITSQKEVAFVNLERLLQRFKEQMNSRGVDVGFTMENLITTSMQ